MKAHRTDVRMAHWGPSVEHWAGDDGRFWAVLVDTATDGSLPLFLTAAMEEIALFTDLEDVRTHQVLPRPTTMVRCDEYGAAIDAETGTPAVELLTEFEFPPGTSAEDALTAAGYEVE